MQDFEVVSIEVQVLLSRDVEGEKQTHNSRHFLHLRQKEEDRLIRRQRENRGLTRGSRMCGVMKIIEGTF